MTTKPDASGSFAGQIRAGKVRASVRGHGVQAGARTKAARSAPPRRQRHGTTRGHAVKVAPCASCDRAPLRAVKPACATARGSDVLLWLGGAWGCMQHRSSWHSLCAYTLDDKAILANTSNTLQEDSMPRGRAQTARDMTSSATSFSSLSLVGAMAAWAMTKMTVRIGVAGHVGYAFWDAKVLVFSMTV